jgi:hypothetical protein
MIKISFTIFSIAVLMSCSSKKDEQFCSCLSASEDLNKASKQLLRSTRVEDSKVQELGELREKKEKACASYTKITAEESRELRSACED